ncbi:MAG: hypothetical protein ACOY3P_02265 [Planctomycetota bacterium]
MPTPPRPTPERCPDCGQLVLRADEPCLLCFVRRQPRRRPPVVDGVLGLDLHGEDLQRYHDVAAGREETREG